MVMDKLLENLIIAFKFLFIVKLQVELSVLVLMLFQLAVDSFKFLIFSTQSGLETSIYASAGRVQV